LILSIGLVGSIADRAGAPALRLNLFAAQPLWLRRCRLWHVCNVYTFPRPLRERGFDPSQSKMRRLRRGVRTCYNRRMYALRLGVSMRVGLHTGECDMLDGKVGGIAAEIGIQIANEAAMDEVLVSSTVKDLVAGSGLEFADRGPHKLAGVPGDWRLFAVERAQKDKPAKIGATLPRV